ncbi:MAG TPA: hypothetical protein PLM53_05405 [Spirochaetota bacterium]|nr:hypothetical protein [Spirochaetota bacterium]HPC40537.1 hypothetical protein [Spirochaetota bacterium]HPL17522.1 hypothetical protein [Spirochaetota bacterium]HQF07955.1 hypothetical protein [Spirochaetota bacterium]HQH96515.1 hypothetical protein [Spirochaetota bacterium]
MKKIDDSKIYLITAVTTLAVAVILAVVAYYSILSVEPKVEQLLSAKDNISTNYKKAYLILRDPQVFAGYSYFDAEGVSVKNSLAFFDKRVYNGEEIDTNRKAYLELLLERRKKGSVLTRNTMVFFLVLSLAFWAVFVQERRSSRR